MIDRLRDNPLTGFFRPFFQTRSGQIFILSAPKAHIRDGLAATLIARHFPLPGYEGITCEPSRPTVQPAENVILVGRSSLFIEKDLDSLRGKKPLGVGYAKLGQRLESIMKDCCYSFSGSSPRVLKNRLTGATYAAEERNDLGKEVDYGVIRRIFRGAGENTILLEGIHGLGTLGAAKVATTPAYLDEIWGVVAELERSDPTVPLEILVRTTFDLSLSQEVYALSSIEARLVHIVYNRKWIYDMVERGWVDQEPYDISVGAWTETPRSAVLEGPDTHPRPSLELEADLRPLEASMQELCRKYFRSRRGPPPKCSASENGEKARLLAHLTNVSDLFQVRLHEEASWGRNRVRVLPTHPSEIRSLRKRFLVHLALCHMLGLQFVCQDRYIRKHFPEFSRRRHGDSRSLVARFTSRISGRLREGFLPLLGERDKPKGYVRIPYDRKTRTYRLLLQRLHLVLKLRI